MAGDASGDNRPGMSQPVVLWVHALSSAEPGYGGWAYVVDDGGAYSGAAGGARAVGAQAMLASALAAALARLEPGRAVDVRANVLPAAPETDLARPVRFERRDHPFLKAWAEEGQKQAKTRGTFHAAIPKPNFKGFRPAP